MQRPWFRICQDRVLSQQCPLPPSPPLPHDFSYTLRRGWFMNTLDYRTLPHFFNLLRLSDSLLMKREKKKKPVEG